MIDARSLYRRCRTADPVLVDGSLALLVAALAPVSLVVAGIHHGPLTHAKPGTI